VPIPKIVAKYKLQKMPFKPALPKQTKMQVFLSSVSGTNVKSSKTKNNFYANTKFNFVLDLCKIVTTSLF